MGTLRKAQFGGKACGQDYGIRSCSVQKCPIDCMQTAFIEWSACSKSCGQSGTQFRTRKTWQFAVFGGVKCGPTLVKRICFLGPCPVHCRVAGWGKWGKCTKSCGRGRKVRARKIIVRGSHGGSVCPSIANMKSCNGHACPVDCIVTKWRKFDKCSLTCGGGIQSRYRKILMTPNFGGKRCPHLSTKRVCNLSKCPIDCVVGPWSKYGACTATCGDGKQTHTRKTSIFPKHGGKKCPTLSESKACKDDPCPVHCKVSKWGLYGACDKSCGGGSKVRARVVTRKSRHGGYVCPLLASSGRCNTFQCPLDCRVSAWSQWDNFQNGGSKMLRTRVVSRAAAFGGRSCPSLKQHKQWSEACSNHAKFGKWSKCSKPCGGGHKYRFWEKIQCSEQSVVKYHLRFRQGVRCNAQKCGRGEDKAPTDVSVPKLTGLHHLIVGGFDLHNNLELEEAGRWVDVNAGEVASQGLPADGVWQKLSM